MSETINSNTTLRYHKFSCDCHERGDDNCWCFMNQSRYHSFNRGLDRFLSLKENHGFSDEYMDVNTGCVLFKYNNDWYYYGPVAKKFKKKGTNKWFSWSNKGGEKKKKITRMNRVLGKCVGCGKDISKKYINCYNCNLEKLDKKLDKGLYESIMS